MSNGVVNIYGAGMSGLIAAINLAREDYTVVVHDPQKGYGGDPVHNPSTHTTPIDVAACSEYIGIDISPAFQELSHCPFYFHDTKLDPPQELFRNSFYTVERGSRPSSLDTLLYDMAVELGVQFAWEDPLRQGMIDALPKNTIIATGLSPSAFEMLGIPYRRWYAWISRGEIGFSNRSWIWVDECVGEYGYLSSVNNYYFDMLFDMKREISRGSLERYREACWRNEGVEHTDWFYATGASPVESIDNPRLFSGDLVLCGTTAGLMDPVMGFGILGAVVGGKVAALAITDPERAVRDFDTFVRYYRLAWLYKNTIHMRLRPKVRLQEAALKWAGKFHLEALIRVLSGIRMPGPIPGFARMMGSLPGS